jgi:hypothetical protein
MTKKTHTVDIVTTHLRFGENSKIKTFSDFLKALNGRQETVRGKTVEFELLEDTNDYSVGLLVTTQKKDVPPKKNDKTKLFSPLDISTDEGLAYANIFYFQKKHSILLYEFNKNGCYLEQFKEFIYQGIGLIQEFTGISVDIKFVRVLRHNDYHRAMSMRFYKSVEVEISYPKEVIAEFDANNGSLEEGIVAQLKDGIANNAEVVVLKHFVHLGNKIGLTQSRIHDFINIIRNKLIKNSNKRMFVSKLIITGLPEDPDISRSEPVDLVADVFRSEFKMEEPRLQADVQRQHRQGEIKGLYEKLNPDFIVIFGS